MKQTLLFSIFSLTLSASLMAQPKVYDGNPDDSTVFSLELNDNLNHWNDGAFIDTQNTQLWDIGTTTKTFFSSGMGNTRAIMTDSVNTYPINANDWFVLKLRNTFNTIITFNHKYETTAGHDGGIVEFSKNKGQDWENVMGDCYAGPNIGVGILTDNFYDTTDTLKSGEMSFSGTSNGWQTSRIQFFIGYPIKTTGGGHDCVSMDTIYVRFRFVSDDTLESKDGWIIDNLKIENDDYGGYVNDVNNTAVKVYPNPSNGIIHFPAIKNEDKYRIEISNMMGQVILNTSYRQYIDLSKQPRGMYIYKISDGESVYTGKLQLQ
jgi:hypothetical protein